MNKLYICFVFTLVLNSSLGIGNRHRRQTSDNGDNSLEDRYGWDRPSRQNSFPGPQRPRPNQLRRNQGQQRPVPYQNSQQPNQNWQQPNQAACIRNCPYTSEYNPVCGSNGVTYNNPGRLSCAQQCGINVSFLRFARCPATNPAPSTSS